MREIQHFKVRILPTRLEANSVYYVAATGATAVTTYITDKCGVPLPLVDLHGVNTVTGTGVTGTAQDPIVDIATFVSSEDGNLITLSTIDGKLFVDIPVVDQNNKVVYFYPTLEELGVATLKEVNESHIADWIQNEGIIIADDQIPMFKVDLTLYPIYFDSDGTLEGFNPTLFYATKDYTTTTNVIGATVYRDKAGSNKFIGNNLSGFNNMYRYDTTPCAYAIDNNGVIFNQGCLYE